MAFLRTIPFSLSKAYHRHPWLYRNHFAFIYLLGYSFMPRIRDLKRPTTLPYRQNADYGVFDPLLTKSADLYIIQEQWDEMIRVAFFS